MLLNEQGNKGCKQYKANYNEYKIIENDEFLKVKRIYEEFHFIKNVY